MVQTLPIDDVLPQVIAALQEHGRVVLQAPPGAGKTTRVPIAMLQAGDVQGRIVMLEPRRLATRASAERLAQNLGESVGHRVGYRMRGETKVSAQTRIEVVTEGILTRMIQNDPELKDVGAVIFDEFHERSLNADLGLALVWEIAQVLRPDLQIVVMSATLDAGPVATLLDQAPLVTSLGRAFEVETRFLDKPRDKKRRVGDAVADLIKAAVNQSQGSLLAFLPGEREIRDVAARLQGQIPDDCHVHPLYGALPFKQQRAAIAPATEGRKIVLATAIAETSLTIEGVKIVVDAGLARRARYDPNSGMSRLVTEPVSRAEATQRAGRAGRVEAGVCYKLWTRGEDGALPAFAPAEVEIADLAGFALEVAMWGSGDLSFLSQPPKGAMQTAQDLLRALGALDEAGKPTDHGRALAALPLHPRLAHMVTTAGKQAAPLAALLSARDPLRGAPVDLALRMKAIKGAYRGQGEVNHAALAQIKADIPRLSKGSRDVPHLELGVIAALAYPDRIAMRRKGKPSRYLLSGGKGAVLDESDPLAASPFLVATDLDGDNTDAKIRQAAAITLAQIEEHFADGITEQNQCAWSRREGRVLARRQRRLGQLVLEDHPWPDAPQEDVAVAMLDGVRQIGLRPSKAAKRLMARIALVDGFPAMDDQSLLDTVDDWLLPHLGNARSAADWNAFDMIPALKAMLSWGDQQTLDRVAPAHFITPLGRKIPIDYDGDAPQITLRLQEMFGQTRHPMVGQTPLRVTLLSPGQKPVQTTQDIVGFWATSYADVRRDMRGRYPRHPWPEDPTQADPTLRAKPRGK